ncbi:DDE-type integrase/transposase/recombinase [Amycolatopsis sp. cmx-11-51]|uniref:DDE-type integrase/transposase/recombinase n=1 Tax=unclassified Amycolatopsis TaxID=2618356 RepID=UPI0039E29A63
MIDLHTREVVGHAMADHMRADLACDAITLATARGLIGHDAVFHSDRGVEYTLAQFRRALAKSRIRSSIGRVGSCYDNAVAESFFATLKTEIGTTMWRTRTRHDTTYSAICTTTTTTVYIRQSATTHQPNPYHLRSNPRSRVKAPCPHPGGISSRHAPEDYARVLDWFPLAELELLRHDLTR